MLQDVSTVAAVLKPHYAKVSFMQPFSAWVPWFPFLPKSNRGRTNPWLTMNFPSSEPGPHPVVAPQKASDSKSGFLSDERVALA